MPIISFANPKGGAGKTTSALLLAGELAQKGARIVIVDADPERWISQWGKLPGRPDAMEIVDDVIEDTIVDKIETATESAQFVIVDLEGTASLMVANAIGMSDLVVIPAQGASMDAKGAAKKRPRTMRGPSRARFSRSFGRQRRLREWHEHEGTCRPGFRRCLG